MRKGTVNRKLFLLAAVCMGVLAGCGSNDEEIIVMPKSTPIIITYGESINAKECFNITVTRNNAVAEADYSKLKFTYTEDLINEEQDAKWSYNEKTDSFKLQIQKAKLPEFSVSYRNDMISWDEVTGAKEYEIYIDGKKIGNVKAGKALEYSLADYEYSSNSYKIQVKAIPEEETHYESAWSAELVRSKLEMPSNIVYQNNKISWDAVNDTCKYVVKINEEHYTDTYDTFVEYEMPEGKNTVEIKAVSNDENTVSSNTATYSFERLQAVTDISYSKGKLEWFAPKQKCKYEVKIDEETIETMESSLEYSLEIGKLYTIEIKAMSSGNEEILDSEVTQQLIQYNQLEKPEITLNQGKTDLDYVLEVGNAQKNSKYLVEIISYVDNVQKQIMSETISKSKYEFSVSNDITKMVVKVTATDETGIYADSQEATFEKFIAHDKLATPQVKIERGENYGCYVISYPKVDGADRYKIEVVEIISKKEENEKYPYSERILTEYDVSVTRREIELRENTVEIEVRVTAYSEIGVRSESVQAVVKKKITW